LVSKREPFTPKNIVANLPEGIVQIPSSKAQKTEPCGKTVTLTGGIVGVEVSPEGGVVGGAVVVLGPTGGEGVIGGVVGGAVVALGPTGVGGAVVGSEIGGVA